VTSPMSSEMWASRKGFSTSLTFIRLSHILSAWMIFLSVNWRVNIKPWERSKLLPLSLQTQCSSPVLSSNYTGGWARLSNHLTLHRHQSTGFLMLSEIWRLREAFLHSLHLHSFSPICVYMCTKGPGNEKKLFHTPERHIAELYREFFHVL
jgi:hypothetical protein